MRNLILETITFIDSHIQELGESGLDLMVLLFKTMKPQQDQSRHERLKTAYKNTFDDQTPSWFAHKGADFVSTNVTEMFAIAGKRRPIEPYKKELDEDKHKYAKAAIARTEQIRFIKRQMGNNTLENTITNQSNNDWLKNRVDFIQTNRGFFLLGNSYIQDTEGPPLILHIREKDSDTYKKIILGGKEGEYQYRLKKGDIFKLEDPTTGQKIMLELDDSGKLKPHDPSSNPPI